MLLEEDAVLHRALRWLLNNSVLHECLWSHATERAVDVLRGLLVLSAAICRCLDNTKGPIDGEVDLMQMAKVEIQMQLRCKRE